MHHPPGLCHHVLFNLLLRHFSRGSCASLDISQVLSGSALGVEGEDIRQQKTSKEPQHVTKSSQWYGEA